MEAFQDWSGGWLADPPDVAIPRAARTPENVYGLKIFHIPTNVQLKVEE